MSKTLDMTKGNPGKLIFRFSLPLIITNLGQQLYMIVDAAIVGRGVGVKALAAVGSADWIYWLILWTAIGLTQGFATFVARDFGKQDFYNMNKTIAMSATLCAIVGSVLTIIGLLAGVPVLKLLDTPDDIIRNASIYLLTMIAGTLVVVAYNMASSILRAFGNGKTPMIAMVIAALLNVGLDCIFVLVFHWGVFGAAFASVLSQFVSFIYCLATIKKIECVKIDKSMWKFDFSMAKELMGFGVPISVQFIIIALSGIILQSTINLQGSVFVAGYTAVNKMYGLLECTAISLGTAFTTYFAQNFGAGQKERVLSGVKTGIILSLLMSVAVAVFILLAGKALLQMFLDTSKDGGAEALEIAWRYLFNMSVCLPILYIIYVYRNVLQAVGVSVWSMVSGIAEFSVRVFMGKAVILWLGVDTLFYVEPASWIGALLLVMIPYYCYKDNYLLRI